MPTDTHTDLPQAPRLHLAQLFARFLRFGMLGWGGPVAQIGLLRHELVDRERWVDSARFNRVLAVYQALPGPEASELCIYFGTLARGRIGGFLAGLGFMLPGTLFVLATAWLYVEHGIDGELAAAFAGAQVAAVALVLRAVHRIGSHALHGVSHWVIAALVAALVFVPFGISDDNGRTGADRDGRTDATLPEIAGTGLAAGGLSFGGAYTSIGFVHAAAVEREAWLTEGEFLDSIAISGSLPSPLIVFATFVGYVAAGLAGALVMTVAIFLPAFVITLLGHGTLERVVDQPKLHRILDYVTAAVVGLIAATAVTLAVGVLDAVLPIVLLVVSLAALVAWHSRLTIIAVVAGCAAITTLVDLL